MQTENFHENNSKFTYLRFSIGNSYFSPFDMQTTEGILRFMNPAFHFIEEKTNNGENVMVHCLAGAHRAGTTAIAWLMYAHRIPFEDARKLAKSLRDCISPIGDFSDLL